jgi:hypothetical protein
MLLMGALAHRVHVVCYLSIFGAAASTVIFVAMNHG